MPFGYSYGVGQPSWQKFYNQGVGLQPQAALNAMGAGTAPAAAPGTVAGTPPLTYNPAVGGIPSVPDPLKAIQDAIDAYTKQLPALQNLATQQTQANQAEAVKQITDLYPQFKANTGQLGADIADWAAGKISQPTVNRIVQSMAERGVAGGFGPDSPSTNAALMALMGKTSEALQTQALTGQNTLLAGLPRITPTTVSSLGITPESIFNPLYNAEVQAALYKAAPNPADAYNLAMGNLQGGLAAGGRAGAGPYAGTPTTGGTSSPDILKFLESLINRTSGTGQQTSAYYNQQPYANTVAQGGTEDSAIYGSDANIWDYLNYEGPYAGDYVTPPDTGSGFFDDLTGQFYP